MLAAMKKCEEAVKAQYPVLEEITDDYCTKITEGTDPELTDISKQIGALYGEEITKLYVKMAPYMAEPAFMEALGSIDIVVGNNPLFGVNQFGADVAIEVSKTMAGGMDQMAMKMMSETEMTSDETMNAVISLMANFASFSERYVDRMSAATTSRKIVNATDSFVDAIKKMIPEMKSLADQIKLIMMRPDKPEEITKYSDILKQKLGDDLKAVIKEKEELMNEQKVSKSVGKLGAILNEVPF